MQFQVDAGDSRPTFFELVATDRLVPSLRAALVYSLRTLAERRPGVTRILDHEAEAFALLMLLVEAHSFATSDGSLAEGLYGLQRVRRLGARGGEEERGGSGGSGRRRGGRAAVARGGLLHSGDDDGGNGARRSRRISGKQRLLSVLVLVGLPYAREKLDALYVRLSGAVGAGSRGALGSTIAEAILGDHEPPGRSSRDEGARDGGATAARAGDNARAGVRRRPRPRRRVGAGVGRIGGVRWGRRRRRASARRGSTPAGRPSGLVLAPIPPRGRRDARSVAVDAPAGRRACRRMTARRARVESSERRGSIAYRCRRRG